MKPRTLKELKTAGFPDWDAILNCTCGLRHDEPTLDELIDACGDEFVGVFRTQGAKGWTAVRRGGDHFRGTTRRDAVSFLWLALHPMNETDKGENRPTT